MLGQIISWAIEIGLLLWLLAGIASLWVWGGARRSALGHLMAGALLLVSGAIFTYVPWINAFARMDNAYLGNAFGGLFFILFGVTLLIGSLAGYHVPAWLAALLWLTNVAFYWYGLSWLTRVAPLPYSEILLYTALVLGGVLLYIALRGYLIEAGIAVALISVGVALAWRLSGGDLRAFTPVTIVDDQHFYKPPVLDFGPLLVCLLTATVLFFAGRFIQGRLRGQQPPAMAPVAPSH